MYWKGEPMIAQNSIKHVFKRILRKAKLRNICFQVIRHTYASLLLSAGVSLVYVKEQMGLSSIQMTVGIYGYWIPSGTRADVHLLDMPLDTPKTLQPDVTQPQPQKSEGPQPVGIAALF